MNNATLQTAYDTIYATDEQSFHTCDNWEESLLIHRMGEPWAGKRVLEIGCGRGRLAALIAMSGAEHVRAVDYSAEAIRLAAETFRLPNLTFTEGDWGEMGRAPDRIVMQGVLEHQDDPWGMLDNLMERLSRRGLLITSSPNFLNPRGFVWQTLQLLFGVPMSLTDLHFISVPDMLAWAESRGHSVDYESCHHSWAGGNMLLADFARRLPNALRDAGLPTEGVPRLLDWLTTALSCYRPERHSGANVVYQVSRYRDGAPPHSATAAASRSRSP